MALISKFNIRNSVEKLGLIIQIEIKGLYMLLDIN